MTEQGNLLKSNKRISVEKSKRTIFLELYEANHQQLSRFCRAISGNIEDAEDLMNDTLLTVFEGFDQLRDTSAFRSYIFSVASNLNKKKFRRLKFRAEFNEKESKRIIDASQDAEYLTDFGIVYETILSLPPATAEALILFHISDLPLEDIQKIQGGSLSGVKLRLKRGREKLLSLLQSPQQVKAAYLLLTL